MHRLRHLAATTATTAWSTSPAMAGAVGDVVYPPQTPMDVKSGATKAEDVHFPLRWGIIGASRIGSDWIKCLADVPGASLAAVAARDMDRAQEYAEAHGIPTAYDSYQTLVDDPGRSRHCLHRHEDGRSPRPHDAGNRGGQARGLREAVLRDGGAGGGVLRRGGGHSHRP